MEKSSQLETTISMVALGSGTAETRQWRREGPAGQMDPSVLMLLDVGEEV